MYRQRFPEDPGQHVENTYTRITYRDDPSYCERIKKSLGAIVIGVGLLISASCLIFWNEGRAVQTAKSLQEGLNLVISLQNTEVAIQENNHKLVHLSGPLRTDEVLSDKEFDIVVPAVKLRRKVEMYQWQEQEHKKETKEGERTRIETTYSYNPGWYSELVRSSEFANPVGHHNPRWVPRDVKAINRSSLYVHGIALYIPANVEEMPINSMQYKAGISSIGNFRLSEILVNKIGNFRQVKLTKAPTGAQVHSGMAYYGSNPMQPRVGDVRVTFEYAGLSDLQASEIGLPDVVSVIGMQLGTLITGYQTNAGDKLEFLYSGYVTPQKMIGNEQLQNSLLCWGLRLGGWLLMFIGFGCLTRIIVTIVDWIPIVRDVVHLGVTTFNAILSISLSLTIIALGWLWYRPLLGGTILVMASLPFILSRRSAVTAANRRTYYQSTQHAEY